MFPSSLNFTLITSILLGCIAIAQEESSNEEESAPQTVPGQPELKFNKWSGEVNVPDPVAISLDDEGNAYVTQTQRRKSQDLDIRNNRDWIENDVSFQSVQDKRAFYLDRLAPEHSEENKERVEDMNGDGSHDYRDLLVLSEKVHLLKDTDGDGEADQIQLYADGFQTEVTGIAAGVIWHEGEVYSTIAPDVWKMRDTDGDGQADQKEIMASGFGLHIAYAGHDMHGLTLGPDGKIYWSIGDKGISTTSQEGKKFLYPNQGGVMRCNPDGSDFEVFAHGLRNVQEMAFDEYGNLFGVDNDADQPGEKERFVYIVRNMDAGWRCNFQYRGSGYNPWTAEKIWQPHQAGQPAYFLPPIVNYEDGPAGFVYNPGTALSPEWRNWFFMTEAPRGNQWAFQAKPKGASFEMVNSHQIGTGIALVGMNWGPDGGLYSVDWGGGYPLNQSGAVWKIDVPGAEQSPERQEVRELMRKDYRAATLDELTTLLAHADQRIRKKAQFELVTRGEDKLLAKAAQSQPLLGRIHAIWGLGQLAREDNSTAISTLANLLKDSEPEIPVQTLKMLSDLAPETSLPDGTREQITTLLGSDSPRLRYFAATTTGHFGIEAAGPALVKLLVDNNGEDMYLRHAGIEGLKGIGAGSDLADHDSSEVRLCAVVALRRATDPAVARFLGDTNEAVATEAALAIHDDWSIQESLPDLAETLSKTPFQNESLIRRAINANLRLGKPKHALQVARYAASLEAPMKLRLDALAALKAWGEPPALDRVDGRYRKIDPRPLKPIAEAIGPELGMLLASTEDKLVEESLGLAATMGIELESENLMKLLKNDSVSGSLRAEALNNLKSDEALDYALESKDSTLRIHAAELLTAKDKKRAVPYLSTRLEKGPLREKQASLAQLAKVSTPEADAIIETWAGKITDLEPALYLDVIEAAKARSLDAALANFEATRDPAQQSTLYAECLEGGDAAIGKEVFMTHLAAQCIRCHKVEDGAGSIIGPNLKNVGSKGRLFILESLVEPTKEISKGYGTITLTLEDRSVVAGQFRSENDDVIEIRDPNGKVTKIAKEDVSRRGDVISVMPPMGLILNKRELRDVIEYLSKLKVDEEAKGS